MVWERWNAFKLETMKQLHNIAALVIIIFFTACSTDSTVRTMPDHAALEAEVHAMFTHSMEVFRNKDLEGMVGRFTENGSLKLPNAPLFSGRAAIRANYERTLQLEDFDLDLSMLDVKVSAAGDMAYAQAEFAVSFTTPGGPFSDKGITLMVLERVNNSWKIASENLSSGPPELTAAEVPL
jgi:ketosteroid isomerase-like protein